jgi:hypothetical protein
MSQINAIESVNARYRRAVRGPRALPDRTVNAFAITFEGRLVPSTTN